MGDELPLGWEEAFDGVIGRYYINHMNRKWRQDNRHPIDWNLYFKSSPFRRVHTIGGPAAGVEGHPGGHVEGLPGVCAGLVGGEARDSGCEATAAVAGPGRVQRVECTRGKQKQP